MDCSGSATPTIAVGQSVRDADLTAHPFLTATVTPGELDGTDAPLRFRFRLVHADGQTGRGRPVSRNSRTGSRQRGRGRNPEQRRSTKTSETFQTRQGEPCRLFWDLSDLDDRLLSSVVRLELVCERADRSDGGRHARLGTGVYGSIFVDDVTLTDSPDAIAASKLQTHWQRLVAGFGSHKETVPEVKTSSAESGTFVFENGEASYDFEIRDDEKHVFTLADRTYYFEDGMAAVEAR